MKLSAELRKARRDNDIAIGLTCEEQVAVTGFNTPLVARKVASNDGLLCWTPAVRAILGISRP